MKNWKTITALTVGILLLVIILQNTEVVAFRILFWSVHMSRIVALLSTLIAGFIAGILIARRKRS